MSPAVFALNWLGKLPAPLLAVLGWTLGLGAFPLTTKRRRIVVRNLARCFPERSRLWRAQLLVRHYATLGRFFVDNCVMITASTARIKKFVRLNGKEHLRACAGKPVILAVPHFHGLLLGCVRMAHENPIMALHTPQHGALSKSIMNEAAVTCGSKLQLFSNRDRMIAKMIAQLRKGLPLYYPGDIDQGGYAKYAFAPFLGVAQTATLTAVSRLAKTTGAAVLPCVTVMRPLGGYQMTVCAPLADFPSGDQQNDLCRYNEFIGEWVKRHPTQYYWPHRRFKTRPPGDEDFYV